MSDFTKWVDLVNKLRAENAALTAERDRYKAALEKIAEFHYDCDDDYYSCPAAENHVCLNKKESHACICWCETAREALK